MTARRAHPEARAELVRRLGFHEFVRQFWTVAQPGLPFVDGWYIGALCNHLEAVSVREILRLVISMPPRTGKSTIVSVLWPAWHWTWDPAHRWLFASYADELCARDGQVAINVLTSPDYRAQWPDLKFNPDSPAKHFKNRHGGFRLAVTPGGKGTGFGSQTQVVDDPTKAKDAHNREIHDKVYNWHSLTMANRIDGPPEEFARVCAMQRQAEYDLAGRLLAEGYEHLCLPMRYVPQCFWDRGSTLGRLDPRTEPGEILTSRYTPAALDALERELAASDGPAAVEAQNQQNPIPDKGGILEKDWLLREWSDLGDVHRLQWVQSWDFGFKGTNAGHSRVGGQLWAADSKGTCYLVDETEPAHLNYPESRGAFLGAQSRPLWNLARTKLIEDKANGPAILAELKDQIPGLVAVEPKGDKAERLARHSLAIKGGAVLVPSRVVAPWVDAWRHELVSFPNGQYDDRVDMCSQALDCLLGAAKAYTDALAKIATQGRGSLDRVFDVRGRRGLGGR